MVASTLVTPLVLLFTYTRSATGRRIFETTANAASALSGHASKKRITAWMTHAQARMHLIQDATSPRCKSQDRVLQVGDLVCGHVLQRIKLAHVLVISQVSKVPRSVSHSQDSHARQTTPHDSLHLLLHIGPPLLD